VYWALYPYFVAERKRQCARLISLVRKYQPKDE
jgi:hypothetical protein